jgi:hypothetical protein
MIEALQMKLKEDKLYLCLIDPAKAHSSSASANSNGRKFLRPLEE